MDDAVAVALVFASDTAGGGSGSAGRATALVRGVGASALIRNTRQRGIERLVG
jgi:hypothetical protein